MRNLARASLAFSGNRKNPDVGLMLCPALEWLYFDVCITMKKMVLRSSPVAQRSSIRLLTLTLTADSAPFNPEKAA